MLHVNPAGVGHRLGRLQVCRLGDSGVDVGDVGEPAPFFFLLP